VYWSQVHTHICVQGASQELHDLHSGASYKRLSSGRFRFWPKAAQGAGPAQSLEAHELQVLLSGGDFEAAGAAPIWRRVA
jgi:hypothetical protein